MMTSTINLFFILLISAGVFGQAANSGMVDTVTIPYGNNPEVGRYYNIRGIKIYAEEYGKGMPLLMIHGNGGSGQSFKQVIPYFSKNYRVIIADSRAQGKSVDTGDSLSFEMIADDETALLDAMHIDSAYVLGTSDGGIVALVLAMRHPDKVIKLAETGADLVPDSTGIAVVHSSWLNEKKFYDENINKTFATENEKNHWKVKMLDWRQPDIPFEALQAIRCPALVISGDHDMFKVEHALQIYHHIPRAYLWVVPNSGHGTMREHTDEFIKKVDDFFNEPYKERKNYIL
ncbi:MAG: alpha/beta hydrolase [Bacteroidota bacterium]|nr:alpha/beta hydrolase [Bacteroidota bacterium]